MNLTYLYGAVNGDNHSLIWTARLWLVVKLKSMRVNNFSTVLIPRVWPQLALVSTLQLVLYHEHPVLLVFVLTPGQLIDVQPPTLVTFQILSARLSPIQLDAIQTTITRCQVYKLLCISYS